MRVFFCNVIFVLFLAGCSAHQTMTPATLEAADTSRPLVWERGSVPPQWTYFAGVATPLSSDSDTQFPAMPFSWPVGGAGGMVFFGAAVIDHDDFSNAALGFVNYSGTPFEALFGGHASQATRVVKAADGTIWWAGGDAVVGATNSTSPAVIGGYFTDSQTVPDIAVNSANDAWFTVCCVGNYIVHGTNVSSDARHFYRLPDEADRVQSVVVGPDRNIYATIQHHASGVWVLGKLVPSTSVITEYALPAAITQATKQLIVAPDGNIWFAQGKEAYKASTSGTIKSYPLPAAVTGFLTIGPDNDLWLLENSTRPAMLRMSTAGTVLGDFTCPSTICSTGGAATGIGTGTDRNIWFTTASGLGAYVRLSIEPSPSSIAFTSVGQSRTITVTETNYTGNWTASSTEPRVVQVKNGPKAGTFITTSVGKGTGRVIIHDEYFNYYGVSVTVP